MTNLTLSDQEQTVLQTIAQQTGKPEEVLVHEAIALFISRFQLEQRQRLLRQAHGMWRDRTDLPELAALRREFDRLES